MYTLREFRMHTKKAFDGAAQGHEVVIKRGEQSFQLVALVDLPLGSSNFESTPKAVKPIKERTPGFKPIKKAREVPPAVSFVKPDWTPCVHGADPELCRHASPGKPCKTRLKGTYVDRDMLP